MREKSIRTANLGLRISPDAKEKLQAAAVASKRSVSDFVIESALIRAEETLADRTRFGLNAEQRSAFLRALDAPPRELPKLRRLFQESSVFESHKVSERSTAN